MYTTALTFPPAVSDVEYPSDYKLGYLNQHESPLDGGSNAFRIQHYSGNATLKKAQVSPTGLEYLRIKTSMLD